MKQPKDKNYGMHPADPDYIEGYDPDEELELWIEEQERKDDERRCDR